MTRSGLRKVVKFVKGKKGSVRRSYWMKAPATPEQEKINHAWANKLYSTGLKNAFGIWGAHVGMRVGTRIEGGPTPGRGLVFGQLGGYAAGRLVAGRTYKATKKLISARDKRIIGMAGHAIAIAGAANHVYTIHKRWPGSFDFFSKDH